MSEKLKPCPFCGENDIRESDIKEVHPEFGISGYAVWCGNCGAYGGSRNRPDLAVKAWNRRSEQKEPDFYICTESFLLANIGDEGELLETQSEVLKGSVWSKEKSEYRFCSTSDSVRLENSERWIEISSDSFSKYFTPVWRNK